MLKISLNAIILWLSRRSEEPTNDHSPGEIVSSDKQQVIDCLDRLFVGLWKSNKTNLALKELKVYDRRDSRISPPNCCNFENVQIYQFSRDLYNAQWRKWVSTTFSPFGPAVWAAIKNIYMNILFYYIDIFLYSIYI